MPGQMFAAEGTYVTFGPAGGMNPWRRGIPLSPGFHCCLSCGHAWTRLEPNQVQAFIGVNGNKLGQQHLDTILKGPHHDLPDDPAAREAAEKVAEIDALLVWTKDGEATRRYRELTGKTWDQALLDIRRWRRHDRATKLEFFGWPPPEKEKPVDKDLETAGHPMRDPWLDG